MIYIFTFMIFLIWVFILYILFIFIVRIDCYSLFIVAFGEFFLLKKINCHESIVDLMA